MSSYICLKKSLHLALEQRLGEDNISKTNRVWEKRGGHFCTGRMKWGELTWTGAVWGRNHKQRRRNTHPEAGTQQSLSE